MTYATMTSLKSSSRRADTCYHRAVCSDILHKVHYHFGPGRFRCLSSDTAVDPLFDELRRAFPAIEHLFLRDREPESLIPVRTSQSKTSSAGANRQLTQIALRYQQAQTLAGWGHFSRVGIKIH